MNAYVYFLNRSASFPSVLPEHQKWFEKEWKKLLLKNPDQETILQITGDIVPVISDPMTDPENQQKEQKETEAEIDRLEYNRKIEFADFFAFAFCYLGLYQGVYVSWIEPFLSGAAAHYEMNLSLGLLLNTIGLYVIFKGVLHVIFANVQSYKRWLVLAGLFFVYIGLLFLTKDLNTGVEVPVWLVTAVTLLAAIFAHKKLMKLLHSQKQTSKRI